MGGWMYSLEVVAVGDGGLTAGVEATLLVQPGPWAASASRQTFRTIVRHDDRGAAGRSCDSSPLTSESLAGSSPSSLLSGFNLTTLSSVGHDL